MTFHNRLLLTSLATLALGLGALLAIGNLLLADRSHAEATSVLRARLEAQVAAVEVTPAGVRVRETPNDATLDHLAWVLSGPRVIERPDDARAELERAAVALGRERVSTQRPGPDHTLLAAAALTPPGGRRAVGAVVVALSVAPLENLRREVLVGSLIVASLILIAGALVIARALRGALGPVARMTANARDWSAHDLDRRFDLGPARDELTELASTLDGLLARISASRRHEQRFASEVAHELRTPLAGLRGRAELALMAAGPDAERERVEALHTIVKLASELDHAVDTLVALARGDLEPSSGSVDLAGLAREYEGVDDVTAPTDAVVAEGEPDIIRRAIAPLIDNARRYAHERVTIEVLGGGRAQLVVRDDGPGVPSELTERVFEPGYRGRSANGSGAGLGLPLARRLARSCGGDVTARAGPGGCFVLDLPAAPAAPTSSPARP